jgi:hypothetical protein
MESRGCADIHDIDVWVIENILKAGGPSAVTILPSIPGPILHNITDDGDLCSLEILEEMDMPSPDIAITDHSEPDLF